MCGDDIPVNYDDIVFQDDLRVFCPHCSATFRVDIDAEFEDGMWRDRTQLTKV